MTVQQLHLFNAVYLAVLIVIALLTRAPARRIAGALAGAATFGVLALGIIALGERMGWWHLVITWEPYFLTLLLLDFTLCGFIYLITWRIARRFGWRGLAVTVLVSAVIGPPRDYWYMTRFPEWGPYRGCFLIRCKSFEARWFLLKNGVIRLLATRRGISDRSCFMNSLPMTGTAALLEELSPFLPDTQINAWFERRRGPGRPGHFSPAQLLRVLLLVLLTPAHSFNLLVALLPEQRTWRRFARLPNRRTLPDAKMLHAFREQLSLTCLRQLNAQLLQPLLTGLCATDKTVALIDATDLPAATNTYKKTRRVTTRRGARRWAGAA